MKRLVKRHLDEKYAIFSHLFVGLIAVYYLTDLLLGEYSQRATFAVFWMGIIVSQAGFWIKAKMK
ncbi:MAG: hypothetical protein U5R06_07935 [candidate division KSB1 bacterium]|nr:hypothetical protein [candidate division KSB1 bacterium]